MEGLLSDPFVQVILAGVGGFVLSEWRRNRDASTTAVKHDADLHARLRNVEDWQRDHNSIHGCVQSLRATTEAMAKNVDRLTRRLDQWMSAHPTPPRQRVSPYDFAGARDWVMEDEQ